jgi:microcin C transport system permease protein
MMRAKTLMQRRWEVFKAQKRAYYSLIFLAAFSFLSLTAELWSNSRPIILFYSSRFYLPVIQHYHPTTFGQAGTLLPDYRKLELKGGDWAIWPVYRWDPYEMNKGATEFPSPPSADNWFGTDDRGRDVLARLLYGFRYSLIFSVSVWLICSLLSLLYGGLCGFLAGWVDLLGQRLLEILSTVPQLLLLIYLISIFEPSLTMLVAVSCSFGWIGLSYFVRGEVLRTRGLDYVEAARALGAGRRHILIQCILPNCIVPLITFAPFIIVGNLTALAGLDYLGLGLPAPTPSWGELLQQAQAYFTWASWLAFYPSFLMFLTLLTLTLLGEGVRVAFDPNAVFVARDTDGAVSRWSRWVGGMRKVTRLVAREPTAASILFLLLTFISSSSAEPIQGASVTMESGRFTSNDKSDYQATKAMVMNQAKLWRFDSVGASIDMVNGQAEWVEYEGLKAAGFFSGRLTSMIGYQIAVGFHRLRNRNLETGSEEEEFSDEEEEDGEDEDDEGETPAAVASEAVEDTQYADDGLEERTIPLFETSFYISPRDRLEIELKASHDYIYPEWVDASAASSWLVARKLYTRIEGRPFDHQEWRSEGYYALLDDKNSQVYANSAYLFQLWQGRYDFLMGPAVTYMEFSRSLDMYWSPKSFYAYGLQTETRWNLSDELSSGLNFTFGRSQEIHQPRGLDYWAELKVVYEAENELNFSLSGARMVSMKNGGDWSRNDVYLAVSAAL